MTPTKVMLVDDHAPFRRTAEAMLEEQGLEVVAVEDESRAIESIREHQPDVVLIDVGLSSGTGMELAELIALEQDPPRIILISAWEPEDFGDLPLPAAVDALISKNTIGRDAIDEVLRS